MVTTTKNAVKECVVIVLYQLRNGRQGRGTHFVSASQRFVKEIHKKVAHTRSPSEGSGTDPGSWQSACR